MNRNDRNRIWSCLWLAFLVTLLVLSIYLWRSVPCVTYY